ncbi:hypothetical protein SASPL_111363 [Salvia splendens]|uniref:RING-type E3 ubiquitin transferase n=1 Tax=Salvia splendens TaxID=180675 RepID=A0A8X9A3K0_SALSN|nr:hypothetical protein SASPL_111363 [Salvia splendens]
MREPSVRVREAAAEQIEERQSDWAYSKPIVVLDLVWNLAFVIVSISVLIMSRGENPSMPLRLWIVGYALQCVLHMICVCAEYRKRYSQRNSEGSERTYSRNYSNSSSGSDDVESGGYASERQQSDDETSINANIAADRNGKKLFSRLSKLAIQRKIMELKTALLLFSPQLVLFALKSVTKHLESANTMFSFIWWIIGFYWVSSGGPDLTAESPQLYWLSIAFLAFDVFFVVVCVAVACVIGIAVCCCLPCIIAILYAVADQEGATKEDIERLPKFRFRKIGDFEKQNGDTQESFGGIITECDTDSPTEHVLPLDDAECCICLCAYDDGAELRELPCRHHFHSACIDKWLHINAICPLCKFNILKPGSHIDSEES